MKERPKDKAPINVKALLDLQEVQAYLSVGRQTARKTAENAGAVVQIGKRVLVNREKLDSYIAKL